MLSTDKEGNQIALTASKKDKYAPYATGVYNVFSEKLTGSKHQRWSYNAKKQNVESVAYKGSIVTEGVKHDLYLYSNLGLKNQKFTIDKSTGVVANEFTKRVVDVGAKGSKAADDANIANAWDLVMDKFQLGGRAWAISDCSDTKVPAKDGAASAPAAPKTTAPAAKA